MSELTVYQPPRAPSFTMDDMERVATAIARGGLFGVKDPNSVLTLCLLAHAEGHHPAVIMRDYHMIGGKPSKKSEAMQRDFLAAGGKIVWHTLDDEAADATFSHPAGGEARIDWDMKRAEKAGLFSNAMWKKYPRQMLRARVISEGARTVFPAATSGMYVPEEMADMQATQPAIELTPESRKTATEKAVAVPEEFDAAAAGLDVESDLKACIGKDKNALQDAWEATKGLRMRIKKAAPNVHKLLEERAAEIAKSFEQAPAPVVSDDMLDDNVPY